MPVDSSDLKKTDYAFHGIYRGVVEDNNDPNGTGRLKIRIFGIHNSDPTITPTKSLPWAESALGLSWSGGYNITNQDDGPNGGGRKWSKYNPGPLAKVAGTGDDIANDGKPIGPNKEPKEGEFPSNGEWSDDYLNACGTGGNFVVPKCGNFVFCFFESGNHDKPIYFAMAPMARDWKWQEKWRDQEVNQKIRQIQSFKQDFSPREQIASTDIDKETWAPTAVVNSLVSKPKLEVIDTNRQEGLTNRDVQCITSAQGTTVIVDNRLGSEQIFVIHKNYMEYTDTSGNRKIYVGKSRGQTDDVQPVINDPDVACNYEVGVEGHHDLHILGNYNVYAKGSINIQCDSYAQIDVKDSVGIRVQQGDVDLIVEKGNINAQVAGNIDADIGKNANIRIKENMNAQVGGSLKATVTGTSDLILTGSVKINTDGDFNLTAKGAMKIQASSIDIQTSDIKVSGNVHVDQTLYVTGESNFSGPVKVGNLLSVDLGITCGGFLRNRGPADLGAPVVAHGLIVVGGSGTGSGRGAVPASTPSSPTAATAASRSPGLSVTKPFAKT